MALNVPVYNYRYLLRKPVLLGLYKNKLLRFTLTKTKFHAHRGSSSNINLHAMRESQSCAYILPSGLPGTRARLADVGPVFVKLLHVRVARNYL